KRGEGRDCPHFQELCSQYVDECIEEDDKTALLDHIQECSRCAAYLNDLTLIGRELSHMEEEKAPEELRDEVVSSAVRQQRERAGWRALGLRIPVVALACFAAIFALLVCSGVLGGLFVNTTKQEASVQKYSAQSSVLSQNLRLPDAVTDMSYSYVIAAAGNAGLPELSASAELIAAEDGVEYYRVDGGLEMMQRLADGMESVGYELESVSNDQLVITPTASQGLFIVIRQTQEEE
ncbi:anti-sigma factor family protein, partial [Butyricicoccus sp.]|uniref:anti-sigma factor family protein n=1 Tax=Butyricicoccus sp. TaxID=2049021 RepID=UPI003D7E7895